MRRGARTVTIGGGSLRGRVLRYPDLPGLRPSMQRTKASMFSSLAGWIDGAVFADVYAGAGAVGIEALSRGARFVHFVEYDLVALEALRGNLAHCGIDRSRFRVHGEAVAAVMDARPCPVADAAVIFADPPYDVEVGDELLARVALDALPALQWLVVEHRARASIVAPAGMTKERERRFGETMLAYFTRD
jgi:16S rRNA (guanine966-N2)-methyltransferase